MDNSPVYQQNIGIALWTAIVLLKTHSSVFLHWLNIIIKIIYELFL